MILVLLQRKYLRLAAFAINVKLTVSIMFIDNLGIFGWLGWLFAGRPGKQIMF